MFQPNGRFLHLLTTLIISPTFLLHQYAKLPFAPDDLSQRQRFELALPAVNYLDSFEIPETAVSAFESQTLPDGSPLYSPAELRHLIDANTSRTPSGSLT